LWKTRRDLLTITVPGLVDVWEYIYENYATKDLEKLLRPAISLAANGFYIGEGLARSIKTVSEELSSKKDLPEYTGWFKLYVNHSEGELFVNKELANVLRRIAIRGWDEFYTGAVAEEIVSELQRIGLDIGLDDLWSMKALKQSL